MFEEGGGLNLKVNELTTAIVGSNKSLSLGLQVRRVASTQSKKSAETRNQTLVLAL